MSDAAFTVASPESGQTLAAFLKAKLGLPWSKAKSLVESGQVRVNGQKIIDPAARLKTGKRVEVGEPRSAKKKPAPAPTPAPAPAPEKPKADAPKRAREPYTGPAPVLVYADEYVAVVDKPPGLTTTRTAEEAADFGPGKRTFLPVTLQELLPGLLGSQGRQVFPVHRIDRDTSGLVVFALKQSAQKHLEAQFREHSTERVYLALTRGVPSPGRIETPIARDRGDGRRGAAPDGSGQRAVTFVKVLRQGDGFALVECRLETGRTHQVRVHLGEAGAPLCGERLYDRPVNGGPLPDESGAERPMLHAAKLGFRHPASDEWMEWASEPPADFRRLMDGPARDRA